MAGCVLRGGHAGVFLVDGDAFKEIGFIRTDVGAHGLYASRGGTKLYVANRGSSRVHGPPRGKGRVSVIDFATLRVEKTWPIPGGGSPDMGQVSADGATRWLSRRYDDVVYAIDTTSGQVRAIAVGTRAHGLTVWPQPGRCSLGHTGNMRLCDGRGASSSSSKDHDRSPKLVRDALMAMRYAVVEAATGEEQEMLAR